MTSTRPHETLARTAPPEPRADREATPGPPGWVMGAAFEACPSPLAVVALDGTCLAANKAMTRLLGCEAEDLVGRPYQDLTPEDDLPLDAAATERLLAAGADSRHPADSPAVTKRLRHARGHLVWVRVQVSLLFDDEGAPWGGIATLTALDDEAAMDSQGRWLLRHDPLTGAGNRRLLHEHLTDWLASSRRAGALPDCSDRRLVAALFCDVDGFKDVNDTKGHRQGDDLLVAVSRRLMAACREGDVVARVGGDEFVVVSRVETADDAESLADRFRRALDQPYCLEAGSTSHVRVSVGCAVATPGCTPTELVDRADLDMYRHKAVGRQRRVGTG